MFIIFKMDINERTKEIINIFKKLKELDLGIMAYHEFSLFREVCNKFIKDGKYIKGKIPIKGTKRIITYDFGTKIICFLKYDSDV